MKRLLSLGNIYLIFSLTTPIYVSLLIYKGSVKTVSKGWNNLIYGLTTFLALPGIIDSRAVPFPSCKEPS